MLYDPKWEQKAAADPLALGTLIAWLETKDPNEEYVFSNCFGGCLFSQYLTAHGMPNHLAGREFFPIWEKLHTSYREIAWSPGRCTFRDALERARAAQTKGI